MTTVEEMTEKLSEGIYSLSLLPPDEQVFLASMLRPHGVFTPEQYELLLDFYLKIPEGFDVAVACQNKPHQLAVLTTVEGERLTLASALTAIRPGEYFDYLAAELSQWLIVKRLPESFPVEDLGDE